MLKYLAIGLTAFVALQHVGFLILEMFLWAKPIGLKVFKLDPNFAVQSQALAANQGLYNGFLAAGLVWSLLAAPPFNLQLKFFFLMCVFIAGIFGGFTASKSIFVIQAFPALLALIAVLFARGEA